MAKITTHVRVVLLFGFGFFQESLIMREAISLQGDTATTTAKFKSPNRRKVSVLIRVKMYKFYHYQPLSRVCSGE